MKVEDIKLTEEEKAYYSQRWQAYAFSTEPFNHEAALAAVNLAYECAGYPPPPKGLIVCPSPKAAYDRARQEDINAQPLWGHFDADWWCAYEICLDKGVEGADVNRGRVETGKYLGWWFAFDEAAIVSPHPSVFKRDEQGRLHCDDGPAISYEDGFAIYAIHGVQVPKRIIMEPETLTIDDLLREENAEVARVIGEKLGGLENVLKPGQDWVKLIDQDTDVHGNERALIEVRLQSLDRAARWVHVTCPSTGRQYVLGVPPTVKTAQEGIAWGFGAKAIDFVKEQ